MKLRGFDITNNQGGWVCDCCFQVQTDRQFTPEEYTVRSWGRFLWLAMLKSYIAAIGESKKMKQFSFSG
jgi:hypothetical protein